MRTWIALIALALAFPADGLAQQRQGRPPLRNPGGAVPRAALERQIIQRFVQQTGEEMRLNQPGRDRLTQILQESNRRRRELTASSQDLRRRLRVAIADPATTDARFEELLKEAEDLRNREHELWRRDQEEIGRTLSARQRAIFVVRWIGLQDRIQQMIDARQPGGLPGDTLR